MKYPIQKEISFVLESPDTRSIRLFESTDLSEGIIGLLKRRGTRVEGREFWIAARRNGWSDNEMNYTRVEPCTTVELAYRLVREISRMRCNDYRKSFDDVSSSLEEDLHPSVHIINQVAGYAPDFWFDNKIAGRETKPLDIVKTRGLPSSHK